MIVDMKTWLYALDMAKITNQRMYIYEVSSGLIVASERQGVPRIPHKLVAVTAHPMFLWS